MSYPIAHLRYGLDTTEGCWAKIASQIDQDISQHLSTNSNSSPFDANYLLDDVLYKKSYRVLRSGILALGYLTSVHLDSPQSVHDRLLLTHTYCDLLTMSLYPSTPIKAIPTSIESNMTQEQVEEVLNGCAQRQKQRQKQMEQRALYFDQEHYANVIKQDQIPHNNILLRTIWLLCDILRVIRSIPLPLPHPSIQQLIHLSTHLWLIVQYSFMILLPFTINSSFLDIYPNIWDIHPQCPKLILDNITIPLKDGSSAFVIHLFERHLMLPLPFIRELYPYQAAFTKPGQENKLKRHHDRSVPPCNQHSPNNFFLLLSQYSLLVPYGNEQPTKRLYSGFLHIQPHHSDAARRYNNSFRENVLLSEFSNKTVHSNIEAYRNQNSISKNNSLSDEQLALCIPMSSISALSDANENWQSQIPHLLSYPDPEDEEEKSNGFNDFTFRSHTIKSDLSYSLCQLWTFIFQIVDEYASKDGEAVVISFQFVHQFKLLSIIKDQIERTILSVYWDGEHHLLQLHSLMNNNDVNSPEAIQKECSIGFNLLSFLHPFATNLIPQDVITNSNESNMSKLDNTSLQAIQHMLLRTQHRQVQLQDWLKGGIYPSQTTSIASPIDNKLLINEIPALQRNVLTFELYSGREFRTNDLWRAIAWPLYAYWKLSRNLRRINKEFSQGKDALVRLNLQHEKELRNDMIMLLHSDFTSETNPLPTEEPCINVLNIFQLLLITVDNDHDSDHAGADGINIESFFTPYDESGPYGIRKNAEISDELMLKWLLPDQIRFFYFNQFIQDAIYQLHLLMLIYKLNDVPFGSHDMKLFPNSYSSSFHEMADDILSYCLSPGGWIANNTLFSMLFINPSSLITSLPLSDTVSDDDPNGTQEEPHFGEDNVLCSKPLQLRTLFDPFTTVPFHNRTVLNLDKIFRRTDELATTYPDHYQQIMNILDNNSSDSTPINFHAPLLDFIVDTQLNSVQAMFDRSLLEQQYSGSKLRESFHYRPRLVYSSFFHDIFFLSWDPMVLLVDMRIKQLYQWIFTHKKQYVQLYEQHALIFLSHQTWLQKCPFISEYCIQRCDTSHFKQVYATSLPINPGERIQLGLTALYNHNSMNIYQFGKPLRKNDLPHQFIPRIQSHLEAHRLIYRDHHDNGLNLPSIFDTTTNSGSDPSLTSSITSVLTNQHLYSTAFTIETPHELTQVYKNQLEYLNFWYFNSNILPMYLFRIERQYWILQLASLKYRFARHCIAFSQQTGLTLNRDFFEHYLNDEEHYRNPFFVPSQKISLIPESHREFYDTLSIDIDNPDNYKHPWAPQLYHFQHFLSLFYTIFEPSNTVQSTVISLLHPTIEALKECQATQDLVDKAGSFSELSIHPLLSDMWQSFSYATEYQHYIGSKMLYHRSWAIDYEAKSEEIFTTKCDPVFTYFKYIIHMLYFSLDIENNLPLLQHFLFTVNYYSLNRRFIMMNFLTLIVWDYTDSTRFIIVLLLDHIYRLALDRCIQVDSYQQKLTQMSTFECPFPPNLYSREYIAPIIHQQVELLSCTILGAAGVALSRPYEENFGILIEALYPTYPTQLERGWHNGDPNPVQLPHNDPDEPENDYIKDREGYHVDDYLEQNDAFITLIDPNSNECIPSRRPPQFNLSILYSCFNQISQSKFWQCGYSFPLPSNTTALNILFDSTHPFIRILFGLLNKQRSAQFDTAQHSKSYGSILTPRYIHDYIEASGKTTGNILSFSAEHLIQVPGYSNQTKSCIELLTDKPRVAKSTSNQTSRVFTSAKRSKYHNPLDNFQSMTTEQSSFNIQYCIESFIDLMLVCDNTRPVSSAANLESQPEEESNDTPFKFDFAYLSQIFDSLNFTIQMDVSTKIGSDEHLNGLPKGFFEQNGPGFVSPFSTLSSSSSLTTTTYPNDTPIQIPMAPHCGMLHRTENLRPGFYQPQVFNTPLFQTFHKNPTTDDLILNPILTSIIDYQPVQQHFPKLNQETEAMMTHNLSLHVNEYRRRLYGTNSTGFSAGTD